MKLVLLHIVFLTCSLTFSQNQHELFANKGSFYFYWGWNRAIYSKSDIHFLGENYDFVLSKISASDRPSPFTLKTYFSPKYLTIPQYNFRIGYFLSNKINLSFGADHMKYVMKPFQTTLISGYIKDIDANYNGTYDEDEFQVNPNFLQFEHTDGLNYLNIETRISECIFSKKIWSINFIYGFGAGMLVPRTDATLMNFQRYDEFHISGWGISGLFGIQYNIGRILFIQFENKTGYINMPAIRTTSNKLDRAKQDFIFNQFNASIGFRVLPNQKKLD